MILIYNSQHVAKYPIALQDIDWSVDTTITLNDMQISNFVVIVDYDEGRFRIIKNRETGADIMLPMSEFRNTLRRMARFCDDLNKDTQ